MKRILDMIFINHVSRAPFWRLMLLTSMVALVSCTPPPPKHSQTDPPTTHLFTLGPGDVVEIKFRFWPELNDEQTVRPDGKISLQMVDEVSVSGLTPAELDQQLTQRYETKLKKPEITVVVRSLVNQNIYVGGEVLNPGLVPLQGKMTALQAIINSGGFAPTAKPEKVIVIRKGKDNLPEPIRVDLNEVIYGRGADAGIGLQANDVIYVPKKNIAKLNQFVNQYIEKLLLFRGVSLGFSYDLRDDNDD